MLPRYGVQKMPRLPKSTQEVAHLRRHTTHDQQIKAKCTFTLIYRST